MGLAQDACYPPTLPIHSVASIPRGCPTCQKGTFRATGSVEYPKRELMNAEFGRKPRLFLRLSSTPSKQILRLPFDPINRTILLRKKHAFLTIFVPAFGVSNRKTDHFRSSLRVCSTLKFWSASCFLNAETGGVGRRISADTANLPIKNVVAHVASAESIRSTGQHDVIHRSMPLYMEIAPCERRGFTWTA